jgi:hypothetical protein
MSSEPQVPITNVLFICLVAMAISFVIGIGCGDNFGHKEERNVICKERKVDCPVEFKIP